MSSRPYDASAARWPRALGFVAGYPHTVPARRALGLAGVVLALLLGAWLAGAQPAVAQEPEWRLQQPSPPPHVPGEAPLTPIGLGRVGDVEFWAPNHGLLITDGNSPSIPPGLWTYNGSSWHELSDKCGATDGRIAWAGPDDFWTVSDGRPGQAPNPQNGETAPIEDNTLCHFSGGAIVGSYGSIAFQASSYQAMHAAACFGPTDCWFGGEPLPEPQVGSFHLHWNGGALRAEPNPQGHAVEDMRMLEGHLIESVRLAHDDLLSEPESPEHPSVLHEISPQGVQPTFVPLLPESSTTHTVVPEYALGEFPEALDYLHLSVADGSLWAAAGPAAEPPPGSSQGTLAVLRYFENPETQQLEGEQILGPDTTPTGSTLFPGQYVSSIAAEPGTDSAWLALRSDAERPKVFPTAKAVVAHISPDGTTSTEELPTQSEVEAGQSPKGAAEEISCPAVNDCWLITTEGWLFHLSDGVAEAPDNDPDFAGLITFRPEDQGLPQVVPDAPPENDSGVVEAPPNYGMVLSESENLPTVESKVAVPLLSNLHTKLVHGTTLRLSFHLAVKARVRLIAKRHGAVVASTPMHTFAAGNRQLLLRLDRKRWPTKLDLQTHALAPLPTTTVKEHPGGPEHGSVGTNTESTGFGVLPKVPFFSELEKGL